MTELISLVAKMFTALLILFAVCLAGLVGYYDFLPEPWVINTLLFSSILVFSITFMCWQNSYTFKVDESTKEEIWPVSDRQISASCLLLFCCWLFVMKYWHEGFLFTIPELLMASLKATSGIALLLLVTRRLSRN